MIYYVWTADGDCQNKTGDFAQACQWALDLQHKGAYVVDANQNVHRAAWEPAIPIEAGQGDNTRRTLAYSLACYVTGDDITLTRVQFLRTVADRIEDDLRDNTY